MDRFFDGRLVEWLTAAGTIGATAAAVWLGLKQQRMQLNAIADLSKQGSAARIYGAPDALVVDLANRGLRRATVTGVYWRIGRWNPISIPVHVNGPWPKVVDAGDGGAIPIALNDIQRYVVPPSRERGGPLALVIRLGTGKELKCRLTSDAKRWLRGHRTTSAGPAEGR